MTSKEAIEKYIEKFGGFPYFLFLGADEERIVKAVNDALEKGEKIKAENKETEY